MAVRRPTLDQLRSVAEDLGMHMGEEELKSYDALIDRERTRRNSSHQIISHAACCVEKRSSATLRPSSSLCLFFNDTSTTEIYTLSLHDALPICRHCNGAPDPRAVSRGRPSHGSQETHARSAAQRRRRPRHAYGRGGTQIL